MADVDEFAICVVSAQEQRADSTLGGTESWNPAYDNHFGIVVPIGQYLGVDARVGL